MPLFWLLSRRAGCCWEEVVLSAVWSLLTRSLTQAAPVLRGRLLWQALSAAEQRSPLSQAPCLAA